MKPFEVRDAIESTNYDLSKGDVLRFIQGRSFLEFERQLTNGKRAKYLEPLELNKLHNY